MTTPLDVHVVPHTHWDREWYHPAGRFRQRLVALVDELLDRAHDDESAPRHFLLDGQAVVLDDYLAVRPERRDALAAQLRNGRLEAGPWYVLADELIPSGEALVRNLLAGRRALAELGAEPPPVLYSPDAFGHAAALPALGVGFGCTLAIVWRGLGGARWPAGDTFRWHAPDGSPVLLYHLPPDGYELGSNLPAEREAAADRWRGMRAVLAERSRLGVLLVHNGADHHALQSDWPLAFALLAEHARPDAVSQGSLRSFADAMARRAEGAELPAITGELRDSYGYTWTLQGTFGTRAAQKRANATVERGLLRDVEPWIALGALAAPGAPADRRAALLRAAWRTLLLCHPHDTLCGCSTDEVARAMDARLADVASQADGLRHDAIRALLGHDEATARTRPDDWRPAVIVRNRAARARGGVAEVELLLFVAQATVGPGSAGDTAAVRAAPGSGGRPVTLGEGLVPLQLLDHEMAYHRIESPRHYPRNEVVERVRAVAWVPPMPGYALRTFEIDARSARLGGPLAPAPVVVADNRLDNGLLAVAVIDGRVRVTTADGSCDLPSLLGFEDVGDVGDLYTHSPVGKPLTSAWFAGAHTVHRGPLRGELEARWRMRVPARAKPADQPLARPAARTGRHVEIDLVVRLTLDAGAPFVRVAIRGDNLAHDHRLRIVFRTGVADARVHADAAFGPVAREPLDVPDADQRAERVLRTAPLHRYVTLHDASRGMTVYGDGLGEHEVAANGDVLVTLVRAVGELSRPDLPERGGHAGWPVPTPEAQCIGEFAASFAVLPHGPRTASVAAAIEATADDVLLPLAGDTLRSAFGAEDASTSAELHGEGLACTAIKPAEHDGWTVLRCVNVVEREVAGRWVLGAPVTEARLARLDETPLAPLAVHGGTIDFVAPPRGIVTILVH